MDVGRGSRSPKARYQVRLRRLGQSRRVKTCSVNEPIGSDIRSQKARAVCPLSHSFWKREAFSVFTDTLLLSRFAFVAATFDSVSMFLSTLLQLFLVWRNWITVCSSMALWLFLKIYFISVVC